MPNKVISYYFVMLGEWHCSNCHEPASTYLDEMQLRALRTTIHIYAEQC